MGRHFAGCADEERERRSGVLGRQECLPHGMADWNVCPTVGVLGGRRVSLRLPKELAANAGQVVRCVVCQTIDPNRKAAKKQRFARSFLGRDGKGGNGSVVRGRGGKTHDRRPAIRRPSSIEVESTRPEGATVLPGQGSALVGDRAHHRFSAQRANGSSRRTLGPLGRRTRSLDSLPPGRCPGLGEPQGLRPVESRWDRHTAVGYASAQHLREV
jgi:hypothetical protein